MSAKKTEYATCSVCDGYGKITLEQQEVENLQTQIQIDSAIKYANVLTEKERLREKYEAVVEALKELLEIADEYVTLQNVKEMNAYPYYQKEYDKIKSAIERAKSLIQ